MDKQTVIAFVLIGVILMVWLYLTTPTTPPPQPQKKDNVTKNIEDSLNNALTKNQEIEKSTSQTLVEKKDTSEYFYNSEKEKVITIENDVAVIELSSKGATFNKYFLKEYKNWFYKKLPKDAPYYQKNIQLINYSKGKPLGIEFITTDGKVVSTNELNFSVNLNQNYYKLTKNDSLQIIFEVKDQNRIIKKIYKFYGNNYASNLTVELENMNDFISNNVYDLIWNDGIHFVEENSVDEANYSNASVYYGDEQVIVNAKPGDKVEKDFNGRVDWINVRNKYFTAIVSPVNLNKAEGAFIKGYSTSTSHGVREYYTTRLKIPFKNQQNIKDNFIVYLGPVSYDVLKTYGRNFDKIVDFGSFFGLKFIVRPIAEYLFLPLFNFLHSFISNYGIVIIIFSLIIKIALHPLTRSSMKSMQKMQLLQPKILELKEKFKDDPQRLNKETMKLYSTYGINPAGGCLPLVLQMPIFVALWGLFQAAIELRQQPFVWWINDLSKPDVIVHLPFKIPFFGIDVISGLAILMGITTFFQQKMSVKDPQQKMLVYIMPVFLTLLFMTFPSGLNLYYFVFNVFSIAQQYYLNHHTKGLVLQPVKKTKKQKGFMERMLEAAEQQNAKAGQKSKKKVI